MNNFELEIFDDESKHCTFYSVRELDSELTLVENFLLKYYDSGYSKEIDELVRLLLITMGEKYGAREEFFNRFENEVIGLPPKGKVILSDTTIYLPEFPLRLYSLRLSESIVILFGGGVKDAATNQESSLNVKWQEACSCAKQIIDALRDDRIIVDEQNRILKSFDNKEIIL